MSAKTTVVFSTKGGVGKTFIALNVAVSLALKKKKILLLDFDLQAGQDLARSVNLKPIRSAVDICLDAGIMEDPRLIPAQAIKHPSGFDFIPCVLQIDQTVKIDQDKIRLFLKNCSLVYDFIVIDGGKVFNETLITALDQSNLVLLVATPDVLAVYQARACLNVLAALHFPSHIVKLVLNRSQSRGGVAWQEVRSVLPCDIFAQIPSDGKAVGLALNRGVPCVTDSPDSAVADSFNQLVSSFLKEGLFIQGAESVRMSTKGRSDEEENFWEKFGISQQLSESKEVLSATKEDDNIIRLKQAVHDKLIDRMNLRNITMEALRDPVQSRKIRESAEKIIGDLIAEESGTLISSLEERRRLVKEITDEALGLGPLEEFLADPEITDIMVNNKDELYVEKKGRIVLTNKKFISNAQIRAIIDRIIAPLGRRIDESVPMVNARLPDGSRINAVIPPLSLKGPMLTIRKFAQERITVEDLLHVHHSLSQPIVDFLSVCVLARMNIIVSGGTGSGKTTLLNIISSFIPDNERILTIEDAAELKLRQSHWGRLESRPPNIEGRGEVTIRDLFINSLRMRPDRIIIGECRGPEILDMLQAMNTGHDGSMTTLHANSTRDVLVRMSSMILLSGMDLPLKAIYEMISTAIDIIVQISRFPDGTRKITGITEVVGLDDKRDLILKDIFVFERQGLDVDGKVLGEYKATGYRPRCLEEFIKKGVPIDVNIFNP
ncbi:MAG TPA: ATPase, T2SS/T4P/T4SS family [Candidatus Omnitrophota bacterium]|nr:ATPase, T2SS/T4P/T4SS family [Candidatus Omnitrophota bacterium]